MWLAFCRWLKLVRASFFYDSRYPCCYLQRIPLAFLASFSYLVKTVNLECSSCVNSRKCQVHKALHTIWIDKQLNSSRHPYADNKKQPFHLHDVADFRYAYSSPGMPIERRTPWPDQGMYVLFYLPQILHTPLRFPPHVTKPSPQLTKRESRCWVRLVATERNKSLRGG